MKNIEVYQKFNSQYSKSKILTRNLVEFENYCKDVYLHFSSPVQRRYCINNKFQDSKSITKLFDKLGYQIFLKSTYWKIIKEWKLFKYPVCQNCQNKNNLHVHHDYYMIKGKEHSHLSCYLRTLCNNCHQNWHSKNPILYS